CAAPRQAGCADQAQGLEGHLQPASRGSKTLGTRIGFCQREEGGENPALKCHSPGKFHASPDRHTSRKSCRLRYWPAFMPWLRVCVTLQPPSKNFISTSRGATSACCLCWSRRKPPV